MASTTWHLKGIDTGGVDLVLSRIQPWSESGAVMPIAVTSTFQPASGALSNLMAPDNTECVFAAADVLKPGFAIEFTFGSAVDLWGFRFGGPSAVTWPLMHTIVAGTLAATVPEVAFSGGGILSPAPTRSLQLGVATNAWLQYPDAGQRNWLFCSISHDARTFIAGQSATAPWWSRDGGDTWSAISALGVASWVDVAISADNQVLLAAAGSTSLRLSKDGGATWTLQTAVGSHNWREVGMSLDGQVLLAAAYGGRLWLSKDGGTTWVSQTAAGSRNWQSCKVSADGQVLMAVAYNGNVWLSKDGGATWIVQAAPGSRNWQSCDMSADGQQLLAAPYLGNLWKSADGGVTWVELTNSLARGWANCGMSDDGLVILAGTSTAGLWLSKDSGASWVLQTEVSSTGWRDCAVDPQGVRLLVVPNATGGMVASYAILDQIYLPNTPRTYVAQAVSVMQGMPPDQQGVLDTHAATVHQVADTEFGGRGRIYGTVERENSPANALLRRRVRLHRSKDGLLARETWSDAQGNYRFEGIAHHYTYDVIAWDHEGQYQSVVANDLQPELMP